MPARPSRISLPAHLVPADAAALLPFLRAGAEAYLFRAQGGAPVWRSEGAAASAEAAGPAVAAAAATMRPAALSMVALPLGPHATDMTCACQLVPGADGAPALLAVVLSPRRPAAAPARAEAPDVETHVPPAPETSGWTTPFARPVVALGWLGGIDPRPKAARRTARYMAERSGQATADADTADTARTEDIEADAIRTWATAAAAAFGEAMNGGGQFAVALSQTLRMPARPAAAPASQAAPVVVPLRDEPPAARAPASPALPRKGGLTETDRQALRDIARALGSGLTGIEAMSRPPSPAASGSPQIPLPVPLPIPLPAAPSSAQAPDEAVPPAGNDPLPRAGETLPDPRETRLADQLPLPLFVRTGARIAYANVALFELTGLPDLTGPGAGGLRTLPAQDGQALIQTAEGPRLVRVRSSGIVWDGAPADLVLLDPARVSAAPDKELAAREARIREMTAILDTATDGVVTLSERGRILSLNRSAQALFGYEEAEAAGKPFTTLFALESHPLVLDYLGGLKTDGVASLLNDGREVSGRVRQGGTLPLFMTLGVISGEGEEERRFCAVLRDLTAWKKAEGQLVDARKTAEAANAQKSDFLAAISHEVRTPLNAIIGFAELMLEERFGAMGNDRYKDYLRDIHASGTHVISLVNDLLDLAKIEAGRMELSFGSVDLNDLLRACVSLLQAQAGRQRIVLRMSLSGQVPPVVADERSVRQVVLNILSNAVKFTEPGGQVIVSSALNERGDAVLRIRDTGVGMSETDLKAALEPFRRLSTARRTAGTGLGLPLTKALVEANRAALTITSAPDEGTLVEVAFPSTRVLAN